VEQPNNITKPKTIYVLMCMFTTVWALGLQLWYTIQYDLSSSQSSQLG